jgi:pectinesterase
MRNIVSILILMACCRKCFADSKTIIVAQDGSGDFKTMQDAIAAVPDDSPDRIIIHIKPGIYEGQILLPKSKSNVTFEGEERDDSILTYSLNVIDPRPADIESQFKGTGVVVLGDDFRAENVTFRNVSGDHGQALALRIDGDRAIVNHCNLSGWQDTLMINRGRQYFHDCYIEGRVDFIYGSATAVFDDCEIHSKNGGHVTAASTPQDHPFGFVFLHCKLTGDAIPWISLTNPSTRPARVTPMADLGRPWRPYAAVAYIQCEIGGHIKPAGWNNWGKTSNEQTARYSEYQCTGPGADRSERVPWSRELTDDEAGKYAIENILSGDDGWKPNDQSATTRANPG